MNDYSKQLIYVADDDANVRLILSSQLESDGYRVVAFETGVDLLDAFNEKKCDLIITDIMMPGVSGYEVCKTIRLSSDVPILMISAKDEEIDRILGLELGSDDYISKPFSLREVSLKVRNILKRITVPTNDLKCKNLVIKESERIILVDNKRIDVTTKEFDLLLMFVKNKNRAFSREEMIELVWGYDYFGDNRQVDQVVKRLRKKVFLADAQCEIETVWGYGYKMRD